MKASILESMLSLRRQLHQHPELSGVEHRSASRVADRLRALGLSPKTGVGGCGIVLDLGQGSGPRVALRADLDALPIQEVTGLPFASQVPGVMHACGHDGHSAMLLGATMLLLEDPPPGPVRLIWQPSEEQGTGALDMMQAGALDGVDLIFGGHVDARFPVGEILVTEGPVNASTDAFEIVVEGRGGHGARPHEAVDAIVIGAQIVSALQSVVSREIDPGQPAVLSVGTFQAGCAANVIAATATLTGTVRAFDIGVRDRIVGSLSRIALSVAEAHGAKARINLVDRTPPLINPTGPTAVARDAAIAVVGPGKATRLPSANMGGEDFAWYLTKIPGCYVRFGAMPASGQVFPAHSGRFEIHEGCLEFGAAWMAAVARRAIEARGG